MAFADLPDVGATAGPAARPRDRAGAAATARPMLPSAGWEPTPERFRDPRTGTVMRVWVDGTGGRHYVPDRPA